jgi:hypothetical protein
LIEIKTIKHAEEIEQLTELFTLVFKMKTTAEFWKWKYIENPLSAGMQDLVVALDGNKIVGARPFLLNELWLGDRKIIAAQHCDTMVHPDYRRQGIFNRMGKQALKYLGEHDCVLSFGFPGPMSRKGFASQGYRKLMDIEILFRLINPLSIVTYKFKNIRSNLLFVEDDTYQIEVNDGYTVDLATLDSFRKLNMIDVVRSEENLRWRFDSCPHNKYRYILAKKDGQLMGYAVISVQKQIKSLPIGIIIDYLIKDLDINCAQAIISKAFDEFKRSACNVVATWALGDSAFRNELVKEFGFRSSLKFPYNMVIRSIYMDLIIIDIDKATFIDPHDKTNWRLIYAYLNYT